MPKLPIVGNVSKGWLIAVAAGSAGVIGYVYIRRRNAAAADTADTAATDTTALDTGAVDPSSIDPATGVPYADELGGAYGLPGGYADPATGAYIDQGTVGTVGGTGTTPGAPATNAEWAQQAESELSGVADGTALAAAIGKYLTGQAVTAAQVSLIDQAIAFVGYPPAPGPGGYPPAIRNQPTGPGGTGAKPTMVVTANGHDRLREIASAHKNTYAEAQALNPWAHRFTVKSRPIPKGYKVTLHKK